MLNEHRMLTIEPLTSLAFAPFGDVIEASESVKSYVINEGYAVRYHDLAKVDVASLGGWPIVSIFKAKPRLMPLPLKLLERHPLGSQAFIPLSSQSFLVVVALAGDIPQLASIRCFQTVAGQGVNYARGTWHHPLIAQNTVSDFLVIDRGGAPGDANCDEYLLPDGLLWIEK